jgi:hypothetical protein
VINRSCMDCLVKLLCTVSRQGDMDDFLDG